MRRVAPGRAITSGTWRRVVGIHRPGVRLGALSFIVLAGASFGLRAIRQAPRPHTVSETPIAFWSWQSHTPSDKAVASAVRATGARTFFVHAGQIDFDAGHI